MRLRALLLLSALAGCAGRPEPVAVATPPVAPDQPPAPTPLNAGLSAAATLWHLRAGLNVAALACRGPEGAALVAGYNGLLAAHGAELAAAQAAHQAEYQSGGGEDWRARYDADQTRLYHFWGQPHGRAALCRAAGDAFAALPGAGAPLANVARERLAALDRALAPPRLEVDARVFTGPATVLVAAR